MTDSKRIKEQIDFLRVGDDDFERGPWIKTLRMPQWKKIIELCEGSNLLDKDLFLAARFCEASASLYGFSGLEEGLKLIKNLIKTGVYEPESTEDREIIMEWIDQRAFFCVFNNKNIKQLMNEIVATHMKELNSNDKNEEPTEKQIEALKQDLEKIRVLFEEINCMNAVKTVSERLDLIRR